MSTLFDLIATLVQNFICWIEQAGAFVINAFILALATIVSAVVSIMPSIPAAPSLPGPMSTALSWIAWFFPVGTLVDIIAFMFAAWLIWIGVSTILHWVKVPVE